MSRRAHPFPFFFMSRQASAACPTKASAAAVAAVAVAAASAKMLRAMVLPSQYSSSPIWRTKKPLFKRTPPASLLERNWRFALVHRWLVGPLRRRWPSEIGFLHSTKHLDCSKGGEGGGGLICLSLCLAGGS